MPNTTPKSRSFIPLNQSPTRRGSTIQRLKPPEIQYPTNEESIPSPILGNRYLSPLEKVRSHLDEKKVQSITSNPTSVSATRLNISILSNDKIVAVCNESTHPIHVARYYEICLALPTFNALDSLVSRAWNAVGNTIRASMDVLATPVTSITDLIRSTDSFGSQPLFGSQIEGNPSSVPLNFNFLKDTTI
jgi:hypothetical protein